MMDGGPLLYSINAVVHLTTIGSNSIAGVGPASNADITAEQRMTAGGLEASALIHVSQVDVEELVTNSTSYGFSTHSDGTPVIQTGCACGPSGVNGSNEGIDEYTFSGTGPSAIEVVSNKWQGCASSTGDPSECPSWPPSARGVTNGQCSFDAINAQASQDETMCFAPYESGG